MKKNKPIEGLASLIKRRYEETESNMQREYYGSYMKEITCPVCNGKRLSQTVLSVLIKGKKGLPSKKNF